MFERGGLSIFAATAMLSLPLLTWPRWGMPINMSVREVPLFFFMLFAIVLFALTMLQYSKALAFFTIYLCISSVFVHSALAVGTTLWFMVGAVFFCAIQELPDDYVPLVKNLIVGLVVLEVCYSWIQLGQIDPIFYGREKTPRLFVHGTFGHHNFLGAFLAVTSGVIPMVLLPFTFMGLYLANSLLSCVGTGIVLGMRLWAWTSRKLYVVIFAGVSLGLIAWIFRLKSHDSFWSRIEAWNGTWHMMTWRDVFVGRGIGTWYADPPSRFIDGTFEVFFQAHNEYIQLFFETGLIGLAFLVWFMWEHKKMLKTPSAAAIAISCTGIYLFHLVQTASVAIVLLALAARKDKGCANRSWAYYC